MGKMFDEIKDNIISAFQMGKDENLIIVHTIGNGYSRAEVYLVELCGDSVYKGRYFLKIDQNENELTNAIQGYRFSKVAKIVKHDKIGSYYVMLIQVAGNSQTEYKAFYEIEPLSMRKKATQTIVSGILSDAVDVDYMGMEFNPSDVFYSQLNYKLDEDGEVYRYVGRLTGDGDQSKIKALRFGEFILPNALAYTVNDDFWEGNKLRNTKCAVHGDLHGDNVFYSVKNDQYALIDMSLYREDGYLFYDSAYFELSFLLTDMEHTDLNTWVKMLHFMSKEQWSDVEVRNRDCIKEIHDSEKQWIDSLDNETNAYYDFLKEATVIARVMAGLNYAGKSAVNDEVRRKSYLYACIYMSRLLNLKDVKAWETDSIPWNECVSDYSTFYGNEKETRRLTEELENFVETRHYILVLGDKPKYAQKIYENLSRIRWDGIITFSREKTIESVLGSYRTITVVTSESDMPLSALDNLWCLYANGVEYIPETLASSYSEWKPMVYSMFFYWKEAVEKRYAPDDLQFIIDWGSFSAEGKRKIADLCDILATINNSYVSIALLSAEESAYTKLELSKKVYLEQYKVTLHDLSEYCIKYLTAICKEDVQVPAVSKSMKIISADEYKYISDHVIIVHSQIAAGCELTRAEMLGFYAGKPISWQAVKEHLYIELPEYKKFSENILKKVEKEDQFLFRIAHTPGAGASVMVRALAWNMRTQYPILIAEKMDRQIIDCAWRIYSKSGKHILLFLDGDFSENDVSMIRQQARNASGLKIGILYITRKYENTQGILAVLSTETALDFCREYGRRITESGKYSEQVCETRIKNMEDLSTNGSLCNYRLPFFFGINAFEEDYESISKYIAGILEHVDSDELLQRTIAYISLITYYTENNGLSINYARKLLNLDNRTSTSDLLQRINGSIRNFAYYTAGKIRICHSVVAHEILKSLHLEQALKYESFLEDFITSLLECENGKMSERLKKLFTELFIKRNMEKDGQDEDNSESRQKREEFSPIVLSIGNPLLQEKFFRFLVDKMPDNAHIHHHFGRLIISNDLSKLTDAKEQFDNAVQLENKNPIHYHARGNMYTRYIINHYIAQHKNATVAEAYDKIAPLTNAAIENYMECINLIGRDVDDIDEHTDSVDPVYPYCSIIRTATHVVNYLFELDTSCNDRKAFLECGNSVSEWCRKLIEKAENFDMETEERYERMREDSYYKNAHEHLVPFRYSELEMEMKLDSKKKSIGIKDQRDYLYSIDSNQVQWKDRNKRNLMRIKGCAEQVIKAGDVNDGILWRWFYANAYLGGGDLLDIRIFLQQLDPNGTNLSVQFMQYVTITGQYLKNANNSDGEEIVQHIQQCKKLNQNSNKTRTRLYYVGGKGIAFRKDRNEKIRIKGTVSRWTSPQNGQIHFGTQYKLTAFFVPSIIGMPQEGAVGTEVSFMLGASYDGFRAWDVEINEENRA